MSTDSRETLTSATFAVLWLVVLATFGTTVTSEDGKVSVVLFLVLFSVGGLISGTLAVLHERRYAGLALAASLAMAVLTAVAGFAVLS